MTGPGNSAGIESHSCSRGTAELDGGVAIAASSNTVPVRRFGHAAMATVFEIHVAHDDPTYVAQAAHDTFVLLDRLEHELSRFVPNSDISRINSLNAGETTRVGSAAIDCLQIARHLFGLTSGAFDISLGTGLESLVIDPAQGLVASTTGDVRLDLGGIGKGYAVDLLAERLDEWGLSCALIHGGFSSVLVLDPPPGQDGWHLTLSDPATPSLVLVRHSLNQTALSASGLRKGDHIIDPATGQPVRGRRAAWVAVPRPAQTDVNGKRLAAAAVADGLTTALMLMAPDDVEALCAASPGLEVWYLESPEQGGTSAAGLRHAGILPGHNRGVQDFS